MRTVLLTGWVMVGCAAMPPPVAVDAGAGPDDAGVSDAGTPDAGAPFDAGLDGGGADAGVLPGCAVDNSPEAVARRDGFLEVCATPATHPLAVCGDGSPYKFSYRPATGASSGLLLYFRGGGSCSDYETCWGLDGRGGAGRRVGTMGNTRNTAPPVVPALGRTPGVFDRTELLNGLRDTDQVFIAYCTGDVGQGMERRVLARPSTASPDAPATIETFFHGAWNVQLALEFAAQRFPSPSRVVLYGTSAGALSATNAVPWVVTTLGLPATTPVSLLTEGGVGLGRPGQEQLLTRVLTEYQGDGGRPFVRVGQMSFISDDVQRSFAPPALQEPRAFQAELSRVLAERRALAPAGYRAFAIDGACHTVAQSPGLFAQFEPAPGGGLRLVMPLRRPNPDLTVAGVSFDAWVRAITSGQGPMDTAIASPLGDFDTVSTRCLIPGSAQ